MKQLIEPFVSPFVDWMGIPKLASEHGENVDYFITYVHWLMLGLFVFWICFFGYSLWRFRASKNPRADYHGVRSHWSSYLEVLVAGVEIVLLLGFALPLWKETVEGVETIKDDANATRIRVVAEQFTWHSRYPGPDGVFGRQDYLFASAENKFGYDPEDPAGEDDIVPPMKDVRVPVGKPVIIYLTSLDVIHSFSVHPIRMTQDCIPGMMVPVQFIPTLEGKYQITCAQLCGNGHYSMNGFFTVESQEDYDAWQASFAATPAATGGFE